MTPSLPSARARARTRIAGEVDRAVAESVLDVWRTVNEAALAAQATLSPAEIHRRANAPDLTDGDRDERVAAVLATLPTDELELWLAMVDIFSGLLATVDDQAGPETDDETAPERSLEERVAELEALVAGAGAVLRQVGR